MKTWRKVQYTVPPSFLVITYYRVLYMCLIRLSRNCEVLFPLIPRYNSSNSPRRKFQFEKKLDYVFPTYTWILKWIQLKLGHFEVSMLQSRSSASHVFLAPSASFGLLTFVIFRSPLNAIFHIHCSNRVCVIITLLLISFDSLYCRLWLGFYPIRGWIMQIVVHSPQS